MIGIGDLADDQSRVIVESAVRKVAAAHAHMEDCFVVQQIETLTKEAGVSVEDLELVRVLDGLQSKVFIRVKESVMQTPKYHVEVRKRIFWYYRLKSFNGSVLCTSQVFYNKSNAVRAGRKLADEFKIGLVVRERRK